VVYIFLQGIRPMSSPIIECFVSPPLDTNVYLVADEPRGAPS